jgi:hypothetical protein
MIELYAQGRFPFDRFVRFYPFDDINRAVEDQRNGSAIKPTSKSATHTRHRECSCAAATVHSWPIRFARSAEIDTKV